MLIVEIVLYVWLGAVAGFCMALIGYVLLDRRDTRREQEKVARLRRRAQQAHEMLALEAQFRLPAVEPRR